MRKTEKRRIVKLGLADFWRVLVAPALAVALLLAVPAAWAQEGEGGPAAGGTELQVPAQLAPTPTPTPALTPVPTPTPTPSPAPAPRQVNLTIIVTSAGNNRFLGGVDISIDGQKIGTTPDPPSPRGYIIPDVSAGRREILAERPLGAGYRPYNEIVSIPETKANFELQIKLQPTPNTSPVKTLGTSTTNPYQAIGANPSLNYNPLSVLSPALSATTSSQYLRIAEQNLLQAQQNPQMAERYLQQARENLLLHEEQQRLIQRYPQPSSQYPPYSQDPRLPSSQLQQFPGDLSYSPQQNERLMEELRRQILLEQMGQSFSRQPQQLESLQMMRLLNQLQGGQSSQYQRSAADLERQMLSQQGLINPYAPNLFYPNSSQSYSAYLKLVINPRGLSDDIEASGPGTATLRVFDRQSSAANIIKEQINLGEGDSQLRRYACLEPGKSYAIRLDWGEADPLIYNFRAPADGEAIEISLNLSNFIGESSGLDADEETGFASEEVFARSDSSDQNLKSFVCPASYKNPPSYSPYQFTDPYLNLANLGNLGVRRDYQYGDYYLGYPGQPSSGNRLIFADRGDGRGGIAFVASGSKGYLGLSLGSDGGVDWYAGLYNRDGQGAINFMNDQLSRTQISPYGYMDALSHGLYQNFPPPLYY